ncbi:MAG: hypothetical protein HYY11_01285 [Candidatus Methylomirabilis oxyfera]|nr:hypothetical protein [Candidatus Methylomirabilis oxyfera]
MTDRATDQIGESAAARLHDIVAFARDRGGNRPIRDVWAETFRIRVTDIGALLAAIAALIELTAKAKDEIQGLDGVDTSLMLQPIAQVEAALSRTNLEANWDNFKSSLDDKTMYGLRLCADMTARRSAVRSIDHKEIETLLEAVETLQGELLEAQLPADLKEYLSAELAKIREALILYRIRGTAGLENVLRRIAGGWLYEGSQLKQVASDTLAQNYLHRFSRIVISLEKMVSIAKGLKELVAPVIAKFLPSGD